QQVIALTLQVGSAAKTVVEVTAEAPAVQLASSDISAVVTANTVRELPLNGRSWTDLAALQPGVNTIQTQPTFAVGADRGNRRFGQQLTNWEARNAVEERTASKGPFKRNQFGGAVGGPIIQNRTFFFADFEAIRQSKGIAVVDTVPSNAARAGLLCSNPAGADPSNPCTTNQLPAGVGTDANGVDLKAKA